MTRRERRAHRSLKMHCVQRDGAPAKTSRLNIAGRPGIPISSARSSDSFAGHFQGDAPESDHYEGGSAPFVDNVSVPLLRKCWRHRRLWSRPARSLSSLCVVCRQDSQRRKPFRTSSSAACKIQACREPEGRNCPRDISSRNLGRACRRPRRMSSVASSSGI